MTVQEAPPDPPTIIGADGYRAWCVENKFHRLDGPAVEADGHQEWWVDGMRHRLDGPACIWSNGTREWFVNGRRHRLDGPARIWPDGRKEWWVFGELVGFDVAKWLDEMGLADADNETKEAVLRMKVQR